MRLDEKQLTESGLGDPEFIRELVKMVITDGAKRIEHLRSAFEHQEWQTVSREAHALKGASLNVGAQDLAALCAIVDDQIRVLKQAVDVSAIDAIESEFVAAIQELSRFAAETD